jgi:hypothetical protein
MMKKGLQFLASPEGRKMAKEAFRKGFRTFKSAVERKKKRPKDSPPVVPYDLVKADVKRKIRGTKLTTAAEIKATPGLRRRMIVRIEKAKKDKPKFKSPVIYGKAYASDKAGKTMQVQPLTFAQRKLMKKEMRQAAIDQYNKQFLSKKKKGGVAGYKKGKFV